MGGELSWHILDKAYHKHTRIFRAQYLFSVLMRFH